MHLCQWVLETAKNADTPPAHLTFSLTDSTRVPTALRRLKGRSGTLVIEEGTGEAAAGKHELRESRLLIVGATDEGQVLDEEHIRDLLSLTCIQAVEERVERQAFDSQLTDMLDAMSTEVNEGNTTYLYQEEAVIEAQRRDLKATYDAKTRDLEGKERAAQFSPSD